MRWWRAVVVLVAGVVLAVAGCARFVPGTGVADLPPVTVSDDGYGIVTGDPDAPVQLEFYIEPQCPHCHRLLTESDAALRAAIALGRLVVIYRPLTFLDFGDDDTSARLSNALFAAVDPGTSAPAFHDFLIALYDHQPEYGEPAPDDDEIAGFAERSGLPAVAVQRIADGDVVVDTVAMDEFNADTLLEITPDRVATPTVVDLATLEEVDTGPEDWLDRLLDGA
ncbi:thioredoxin domain-containing protein [uncultured Mycolicibacterium sp.]|uniref:DsbA family protein n=1 Tax=uncultured Mycolicibacterium sp. TaxID=2320817 RepID=UPI00262B23EB|nr:thioredoxin domain-containing protein [uncultured Mycolicibacterium sp.]